MEGTLPIFSGLYAQTKPGQKVLCHFCKSRFDWTLPQKFGHIREPGPYKVLRWACISSAACEKCYQTHLGLNELEW